MAGRRPEEGDRPDRLGAVIDVGEGGSAWLEIREAVPGALDRSPRLRGIAEQHRAAMPVRIADVSDVLDPGRRFRELLPDGEERIVEGEWTTRRRPSHPGERFRLPWLGRWLRRAGLAWRRRRVVGYRGA